MVTAYSGPERNASPKGRIKGVVERGKSVLQQAEADRFGDRLAPAADLELLVEVDCVSFDCLGRDDERLGDLFVAQPLRQERQNLGSRSVRGVTSSARPDGEEAALPVAQWLGSLGPGAAGADSPNACRIWLM